MPKKRQVGSLKRICLLNIAQNIDKLWCRNVDPELAEDPARFLYVIGPFSVLTDELTQELINVLAGQKVLRKSHFHLLLTHRLQSLDLSCCSSVANRDGTIRLVGLRCQTITSLNITYCNWASPSALADMIRYLPHLTALAMSHTKTTDQVVAVIASHCIQLHSLNLFACPVTDAAAFSLCGTTTYPGCHDLVRLDICATRIENRGALMLIRHLPKLQYLHYADSIEAVGQIHKDHFIEGQPIPVEEQHQLKSLAATAVRVRRMSVASIQIALAYCPNVTEVLLYQNATNHSLQHLRHLQHLQRLEITSDHLGDVTFSEGLLPLLTELGSKLTSLGLYDISDLDPAQVGVLCPNLIKFKCVMACFNAVGFQTAATHLTGNQWESMFCHLRDFMVVIGVDSTHFCPQTLNHLLLNASSLESVHLINVQCLSDDGLIAALQRHGFPGLRQLQLESCHSVTEHAVGHLVRADNVLERLILKACNNISCVDFQLLCDYVVTNNVLLHIEWD